MLGEGNFEALFQDELGIRGMLRQGLDGEEYLTLIEKFGGERLYVPSQATNSALAQELPAPLVQKLSEAFGMTYIKVPIDREFRIACYLSEGRSNREIARRLCVTERAVERTKARLIKTGTLKSGFSQGRAA